MKENIIKFKLQLNVNYFLIKVLVFTQIIKFCKFSCDENNPFLRGGECVNNCSPEEIKQKTCEIYDIKLKTQWLTNIIYLSYENLGYLNPIITQDNDLLILQSGYPKSNKRLLYGITREGRGYFKESEFYNMEINDPNVTGRFESEAFMVKLLKSTDNKEYIFSFGKALQFLEIYDIENKKIYFKEIMNAFHDLYDVHQISGAYVKITSNSDNNYLIGLLSKDYTTIPANNILTLFTFNITSLSNRKIILQYDYKQKETYNSKMVSCYETIKKSIVCFYKRYELAIAHFSFYAYNTLTRKENNLDLYLIKDKEEEKFFKCTHYMLEIGAFLYYNNDNDPKAVIAFCQFNSETGCVSIEKSIEFKNYNFNYNDLLNDIVKLSEGKIFFAAASKDVKSLYIVSIHNDPADNTSHYYIERIYYINSFIYIDYYFSTAVRLIIFNNYLASCSNGYSSKEGGLSSLIIFGYPNSTDSHIEITHSLLNDNEMSIYNITISFKNLCLIENNIFGFTLLGIKIIEIYNNSNDAFLLSTSDNKKISKGQSFSLDDNLKLYIKNNNKVYNKFNYGIKYSCVANEPSDEEYNNYAIYFEDNRTIKPNNITKDIYYGKYTFYNFSLNNQLTEEGCNRGCELCYYLNRDKCITCQLGLEFEILDENKNCFVEEISTEIITNYVESEKITTELIIDKETYYTELKTNISESDISTKEKITEKINTHGIVETSKAELFTEFISQGQQCKVKEIIQGICHGVLTDEMAEEIYYYIKNNLINSNFTDDYLLIKTPSFKFQLSTNEFINSLGNLNTSKINLGECENKLKKKYNISDNYSLIIFRIDIENSDKSYTFVQYEVFNPETYDELGLDVCDNILINITIPAKLDSETQLIFAKLKNYGYNLFDPNDKFYNDICTKYTSENKTDILLADRKNDIYNKYGNKTICQDGCDLASYNGSLEEATCQCQPQTKQTDLNLNISKNFNIKGLNQVFFKTLNNSNFRVLKCYQVAIDLSTIKENKGRLMMTLILLIFIILFIIFIIKGKKQLNIYMQEILLNSKLKNDTKKKKNHKSLFKKNEKNKNIKKAKSKNDKRKIKDINIIKKYIQKKIEKHKSNPLKKEKTKVTINKKKKEVHKFSKVSTKVFKNFKKDNHIPLSTISSKLKNKKSLISQSSSDNSLFKNNSKVNSFNIYNLSNDKTNKNNYLIKNGKVLSLNDQELNRLDYKKAVIYDKRTYFQYYWSLLKKKQMILFAFMPANDYNSQIFKISLLILSFSLSLNINGFFFSDKTMHKIYEDEGVVNYLYQIVEIICTTIISSMINIILRKLSLIEDPILKIKCEKKSNKAIEMLRKAKKCIKIQFAIFFALSFLLIFFFWYFISCFCGVYINTEKILINDTLISFGLSLIYPFGLNLLPGIFRIPALRSKKKDKECMYKISRYISLI